MSKVSIDLSASARNDVSRILQALASSKQGELAEQLSVDPSTISRMKIDKKNNGLTEIELFCELLSCLGLKVVPKEYQSIDKSRVEALLVMSKSWMSRIETVDDLFHDEISERKDALGYGK
jgi:DNA-binding Xre family transcriptional regulator